ncbi:MAG TPA: hypothetical protein VMR66_04090 [Gemmatimonadota bacterium]|nr:hypothetical protein [Gemmatimonadota bacterium]
MFRLKLARHAVLGAVLVLVTPALAFAQTAPGFAATTVEVVSEWTGQDRGNGSGSYHLKTRVTDTREGVTIEHDLTAERTVEQEIETTESLVVLEGKVEKARSSSDPAPLGAWSETAIAYVLPFDLEFSTDPRKSYRPRDKQVADLVRSVVPDARVSTRAASDGRTTAVVEIPGVLPVQVLAAHFVGIRTAFRDAEIGLAKLQIKGRADTSLPAEVGSTQ